MDQIEDDAGAADDRGAETATESVGGGKDSAYMRGMRVVANNSTPERSVDGKKIEQNCAKRIRKHTC